MGRLGVEHDRSNALYIYIVKSLRARMVEPIAYSFNFFFLKFAFSLTMKVQALYTLTLLTFVSPVFTNPVNHAVEIDRRAGLFSSISAR